MQTPSSSIDQAPAEAEGVVRSHDAEGTNRDRAIKLSVVVAAISKMGALLLRLVSIPLAIKILGLEYFGAYTVIVMAVWVIDVLHIGVGPALTRQIAKAVASGNRALERTAFSTAFFLSAGLTLVAGVIAAAIFFSIPVPQLFGEKFAPMAGTMQRAIAIALVILVIEAICSIAEMARDGYQETRINYGWGAAGNVVAALILLSGIRFFPSIEFLLIAVNGPIALAKLGNLIHLFRDRPWLFPGFHRFKRALVRPLALEGGQYSVTYILSALIEYNLFAFLIGRFVGPEAVGVFNVMVTIHFSITSIVMMYSGPLWPAMLDAHERNDLHWIRSRARLSIWITLGFSLLCTAGLVAFGPWALSLWLGDNFSAAAPSGFQITRSVLALFSLYLAVHLWRHIYQVLTLGTGSVTNVCYVLVAEATLLVIAGFVVLNHSPDIGRLYAVVAVTMLFVSAWKLPHLFYRVNLMNREPSVPAT